MMWIVRFAALFSIRYVSLLVCCLHVFLLFGASCLWSVGCRVLFVVCGSLCVYALLVV